MATQGPGVMAGGRLVRLRHGPGGVSDDIYAIIYEFPPGSGSFISYQFDSPEQVEATLYKGVIDRWFSGAHGDNVRTQSWWDKNVLAEGNAEEIIGSKDTFRHFMERIQENAAQEAGLRDPSVAGRIANNKEMQQIMAQAIVGEWSPQQVIAEQRKSDFWTKELYPGINKFYGQTAEPERAWAQYAANVESALTALGYERDRDGSYKSQVGNMLNKNINDEVFMSQVPTFLQASQNSQFAAVLNQWAERELGRDVKFNDWFDLLAGEGAPELEAVAERARLAYQGQQASAGVSDAQISRLAERTDFTEAEMQGLFSEFGQAILGMGASGLKRGGLTRDEVLSAFAGVNPESGRSIEEVKLAAAKLAREEGLFDEEKLQFFTGFTSRGTPIRPGLASLAPEAG